VKKHFNEVLAGMDSEVYGLTLPPAFVSYRALRASVLGNARHFVSQGVRRGDYVAMALESDREHIVALLSLIAIGAVPMSVKPCRGSATNYEADLQRTFSRFGVTRAYRTLPEILGTHRVAWDGDAQSDDLGLVADVSHDDICFVQFTSGSTSDPKPIPIRHESLMANLRTIVSVDGRNIDRVCYTFLPLSHDMGLVGGLLSNLYFGNSAYLTSVQAFLRKPLAFFTWCADAKGDGAEATHRESGVAMPDFAVRYLARYLAARKGEPDRALLSGLRNLYCGAEPIRYETIAELVAIGSAWGLDPRALIFCYGMAEATLLVAARRFDTLAGAFLDVKNGVKLASVGVGVDAEICVGSRGADGEVAPVPTGAEGTIFVRGPSVFRGYLTDGAREERDAPAADWHDTGDMGFEHNGQLYVSGRVKELIIVNGENVFPADIERVVERIDGVGDCVAMADGDSFYVLVVPARGATLEPHRVAAEIGAHFGAVPRAVALGTANDMVRTTSGKPMREATLGHLRATGAVA
jgi:acyl-CoA synthetase (AMP-forming)/AMP-acid ligase II